MQKKDNPETRQAEIIHIVAGVVRALKKRFFDQNRRDLPCIPFAPDLESAIDTTRTRPTVDPSPSGCSLVW